MDGAIGAFGLINIRLIQGIQPAGEVRTRRMGSVNPEAPPAHSRNLFRRTSLFRWCADAGQEGLPNRTALSIARGSYCKSA